MSRRTPSVLLAAASLQPGKGGISRVARLIARVLAEKAASGRLHVHAVTLADAEPPADLRLQVKAAGGSRHRFLAAALRRGLACSHAVYDAPPLARTHALPPLRYRRSLAFVHGIEVWENAPRKYLAAARRMDELLVNSDFTRRKADALHGGFARARRCWLATEEDDPPPPAVPVSERGPKVLIVGRLVGDRPKGHRELIACWPRVVEAIPGATLEVVGDGPDRAALAARAAASPAAANIVFHGFVSEAGLGEHYARARVYAMPSRGEGFGLVYVEAMRHGLPVIGSVHDAAPEVIEDGVSGYAVNQDDPEALTAAVVGLLREPGRAAEMGEAGRRRWGEQFRFSSFRDRFNEYLEEFLAE
jgi:phosphatidylinositol alpha-1,6-mannosyltransferase